MIEFQTLAEAQKVAGALRIHRVADDRWLVYEAGDALPAEPQEPEERRTNTRMRQLFDELRAEIKELKSQLS